MARKDGKIFQESFENSCKREGVFCTRIKDQYVPPDLRDKVPVTKNKYDFFIYQKPYLFPVELKSIRKKSFSFSEHIIKQHQIDALTEASKYDGVIPGFIFNFRLANNKTFFVHINDFNEYKYIAENGIKDHKYKSKVNKSSISLGICEEIGMEIKNQLKRTKYHYFIDDFIRRATEKYG